MFDSCGLSETWGASVPNFEQSVKKGASMLQAEGVQHLLMCMHLRPVCPTRHTVSMCFSRRMDRYRSCHRKQQHFLSIKMVSVHQYTCDLPLLHMFVVGFIFVVVFDILALN